MYQLKSDIALSQQDDNTLVIISVLDTENCYYKLTGLNKDILLQLKEGEDLEKIKSNILDQYDVAEDTLNSDMDKLIQFLTENKIIESK